jgi:C_GCAxxG_C_C family probable redox protein
MSRADESENLFRMGFNCSQAVFGVFAKELGISPETANKIACAFGGGMRMGNTCGAVTGALMAIGLKHGKANADENEARDQTYLLAKEFQKNFSALKGSVACRDLLGYDISSAQGYEQAKESLAFVRICPFLVRDAVDILEGLMDINN